MARIHRQSLPGYEVTSSDQADDRICYILGTASGLQGSLGFLRSHEGILVLAHSTAQPVALDEAGSHPVDTHSPGAQHTGQ